MSGNKSSKIRSTYQSRASHYISYLHVPLDIHEKNILRGTALGIYEFGPKPDRQFWTYLTSGMSEKGQGTFLSQKVFTELIFYATEKSPWVIELLTKLSAYPFESNETFTAGDTLPLAGSIRPNSKLTSLFLFNPILEPFDFQLMDIDGKKVEILWVLPITERECELIISGVGFDFSKLTSHKEFPKLLDLYRDTLILD